MVEYQCQHTMYRRLYHAVEEGELEEVKYLLQQGLDISHTSSFGVNEGLIFPAIREGHVGIVEYLLSHGYDVEGTTNDNGLKAIHVAAQYGNLQILQAVLRAGGSVDSVAGPHDLTPLGCAVKWGKTDVVETLIRSGADVNQTFYKYHKLSTPLHEAIMCGSKEIVDILLEAGANVNSVDGQRYLPLHLVCVTCKMQPHRLQDRDLVIKTQVKLMKRLIQCGSRLNEVDQHSNSPLHAAVSVGCPELVRELLVAGAAVDQHNKYSFTPLAVASLYGLVPVARLLIEFGARLEREDLECRTPLILAVGNAELLTFSSPNQGYLEIIQLLIESGSNVNHRNKKGQKVFNVCVQESNQVRPLELLLERGADYSAVPENGMTALMVACFRQLRDILDFVLKYCPGLIHPPSESHLSSISPLCQLARNMSDYVPILFEAGYQCSSAEQEFLMSSSLNAGKQPTPVLELICERASNPHTLKVSCRAYVRKHFWDQILPKIEKLPLPKTLKEYLLLKDCLPLQNPNQQQ